MSDYTGLVPEGELVELVEGDELNGGAAVTVTTITTSSWPCIIASVTLTLTAGACPTSACTRAC